MTRLKAALAYASWGWPVLPIVPNGKLPATAHGVHDATTRLTTGQRIRIDGSSGAIELL